jgi:triosephosphate isomerase
MRLPFIAGNWKMFKTVHEAVVFVKEARVLLKDFAGAEIVVAPPFTAIHAAAEAARNTNIGIAAQDVYWEREGAFTGEISAGMIKEAGGEYVIVGHSERRADHGETDTVVRQKAEAVWRAGLTVIVCIGETQMQRDAGQTLDVCGAQLAGSLPDGATAANLVVAYEPVWAIGTGLTPTPKDVEQVHRFIRGVLASRFKAEGEKIRILYGGSVKPSNAAELMEVADVNGALVGGASLKAVDFLAIAEAC